MKLLLPVGMSLIALTAKAQTQELQTEIPDIDVELCSADESTDAFCLAEGQESQTDPSLIEDLISKMKVDNVKYTEMRVSEY